MIIQKWGMNMAVAKHRQIKLAPGWIVQYSQKLRHQIRLDSPPISLFNVQIRKTRKSLSLFCLSPLLLSCLHLPSSLLSSIFSLSSALLYSLLLPLSSPSLVSSPVSSLLFLPLLSSPLLSPSQSLLSPLCPPLCHVGCGHRTWLKSSH